MTRTADSPQVASLPGRAYLAPVSLGRILSLLLLVGLVLAPLGMIQAPAMAMAGHAMTAPGHDSEAAVAPCHSKRQKGDDQSSDSRQMPGNCCALMCTAIAAVGGQLAEHLPPRQILQPLPPASRPHGLDPEADPPPPRFS